MITNQLPILTALENTQQMSEEYCQIKSQSMLKSLQGVQSSICYFRMLPCTILIFQGRRQQLALVGLLQRCQRSETRMTDCTTKQCDSPQQNTGALCRSSLPCQKAAYLGLQKDLELQWKFSLTVPVVLQSRESQPEEKEGGNPVLLEAPVGKLHWMSSVTLLQKWDRQPSRSKMLPTTGHLACRTHGGSHAGEGNMGAAILGPPPG